MYRIPTKTNSIHKHYVSAKSLCVDLLKVYLIGLFNHRDAAYLVKLVVEDASK